MKALQKVCLGCRLPHYTIYSIWILLKKFSQTDELQPNEWRDQYGT